ncbi:MAG: hypothetical protein ACR2IS_12255, partial [Nitrososphaeraceae archaeon]
TFNPENGNMYVTNWYSQTVSVISTINLLQGQQQQQQQQQQQPQLQQQQQPQQEQQQQQEQIPPESYFSPNP